MMDNKITNQLEQLNKAIARLSEVLNVPKNDIARDSAIQRFEFTLDLAWKSLKSLLEKKKGVVCHSPKDCLKEAFAQAVLEYDDFWISLVDMRNETVHTYNDIFADKVYQELPKALIYFENLKKALDKLDSE